MKQLLRRVFILFSLCGCHYLEAPSTGDSLVIIKPKILDSGFVTKTVRNYYTSASINHLQLDLTYQPSGTLVATKDIPSGSLGSLITFQNLAANRSYRVKAYAYKAAGTSGADLISTSDANSYIDFTTTNDDRPNIQNLIVKLIDVPFDGQATSSVVVTPGGYTTGTEAIAVAPFIPSLSLSYGNASMAPAFSGGVHSYTAITSATAITVTPSASEAGAVITVNGSAVASGSASAQIPLALGGNAIALVTSKDGMSSNYTLNINRVMPGVTGLAVTADGDYTPLAPAFSSMTPNYSMSVDSGVSSCLLVTATKNANDVSLTCNGVPLTSGLTTTLALVPTVKVVATSADGLASASYTVNVSIY